MLLPGSSGWINKYFALLKSGSFAVDASCPQEYTTTHYLHVLSGKTGLVFGYCTQFLFFDRPEVEKWTDYEKLKLLLFETMFWIYIQQNKDAEIYPNHLLKNQFIASLKDFYNLNEPKNEHAFSTKKIETQQIESILAKRVNTSQRLFDNQWWLKTMSNVFVYVDVILYWDFMKNNVQPSSFSPQVYSDYAYNAFVAMANVLNVNQSSDEKKKRLLSTLLSLANLDTPQHEQVQRILERQVTYADFSSAVEHNELLRRFILDIVILATYNTMEDSHFALSSSLKRLVSFFRLTKDDCEESIAMTENLMLHHGTNNALWFNKNIYQKVQDNFSLRWKKIILRNKDKLLVELNQSKELVMLIKKSATQELSETEKEKVREQFLDIARAMPMLAIFMLPGGAIILPLILKMLPTLLPSAFRDNEIEE